MAIGSHPRTELVRPRSAGSGIWSGVGTRRTTDRVSFEGRATIIAGDRRIRASMGDLSEAGAYVHTCIPPEIGETVLFTARIDGGMTLATEATVVWIDTDDQGQPSGCGVAFVRLSPTTRLALSTRLNPQAPTPVLVEEVADAEETRLVSILTRFVDRMAG
jgi:hypothetical protein